MKLEIDENKKFLLIVGISLGVLLLMLGYDSSIRQTAGAVAKDNSETLENLEDTISKFEGHESIAEGKNRILKKEFLPQTMAKLEFPDTLPPVPPDTDPAFHLGQELKNTQNRTRNDALRKNIPIPESDWDIREKIKKNNTPQEVAELRLRLSATSAMVKKCIESNVKKIRKIQHRKSTIEAIEGTPTVIRRLPFSMEVEGDLYSIANILLSFQKEKAFLELRDCEVSDSPGRDILLAKMEMAALRVLDRSEIKEATGEAPPAETPRGGTRPPRRSRRQRY